jgi:ADP-ribose pyrophosphatase YjhB (NUDIX family)
MPDRGWARPVAVGVVRRGGALLVLEGYDRVKGETFWRLPGGTIEFGELGADAVVREFREELGVEMRAGAYLGTVENLFRWEGLDGHELVRVYELEPVDEGLLEADEWPVVEPGLATRAAIWRRPDEMGAHLYPGGARELLLRTGDPEWVLRPAESADETFLVDLHRATMREYVEAIWGWDDDDQKRRRTTHLKTIGDNESRWVIEIAGMPIGMLELRTDDQEIYVSAIELAPAWQGCGVGTSVMGWIKHRAVHCRQPVRLRVLRSNPRAARFYEREGFCLVADTDTHAEYVFPAPSEARL